MTTSELVSNRTRFAAISAETVVLGYLATKSSPVRAADIVGALKSMLTPATIAAAVRALEQRREAIESKGLSLTAKGQAQARQIFSIGRNEKWEHVKGKRLPMLALGLDPGNAQVAKRFSDRDRGAAAAVVIAVAYGFAGEMPPKKSTVVSELVWRLLRRGLPEYVGSGPFPVIEKPGVVERALIAGIAKSKARTIDAALAAVAAHAIASAKADRASLLARVVEIAIANGTSSSSGKNSTSGTSNAGITGAQTSAGQTGGTENVFAGRVLSIAQQLATPPFKGRVAISQVYDAYGRHYADAGSLASFKERLVAAARRRELVLGRLDLPERMSVELRTRSETRWDSDEVHFVITSWE